MFSQILFEKSRGNVLNGEGAGILGSRHK